MKKARLLAVLVSALTVGWAQRQSPGPSPRPDPARETALKELTPVTTGVREDDHPSVSSRNGRVWMAWVSFSETEGSSQIYVRSFENGAWSDPFQLTE